MNSMVLGFAGYSLLLSSCAALIWLLRMGCIKDILKSPLRILSASDTLISMITSVILLINQFAPLTNFEQVSRIAGVDEISNRQLLQDDHGEKYYRNQSCMRFYLKSNNSWSDNQDSNGMLMSCTFQQILMHYAMFLVPFANAFVSLLIFSVQCSSSMSGINDKCSSLIESRRNLTEDSNISNNTRQSAPTDVDSKFRKQDSVVARKDINTISKNPVTDRITQETVLTIPNGESGSKNLNKNSKITGFGLIAQWLVPILVTAILYLSETEDTSELRGSNEMECIFKISFPLESCDNADLDNSESLNNPTENYNESTIEVEDPDTLRIFNLDSEEIDAVVSNVRNVVQSALNKTCYNSTELKYYNNSRPWNITKYVTMNNSIQQSMSDNEMHKKLTDMQQALNNKDLDLMLKNNECTITKSTDSITIDQQTIVDEEIKFFEDVVKSTKIKTTSVLPPPPVEEVKLASLFPQEVETTSTTVLNVENQTALVKNIFDKIGESDNGETDSYETNIENKTALIQTENVTRNLNNQIFADIVKRIRNTVNQVKMKELTDNIRDNHYEAKDEKSRSESRKIRKDRKSSFSKHEGERLSQTLHNINEQCFLSTKFLKLHLLILLFLVYFIPVLVSGILQTRAIYMCKNVFEKIDGSNKRNLKTISIPDSNKITTNKNPPPKPGWFLNESNDIIKTDSRNSQGVEGQNPSGSVQTAWTADEQSMGHDLELEKKKTVYKNVINETKSMEMLFSILTKSLLLGTLMWTPAFLEILSKVFLCASTPAWLVNVLYLLGVSFGIVKNFFNVNIAKITKNVNDQVYGRENSVHPGA